MRTAGISDARVSGADAGRGYRGRFLAERPPFGESVDLSMVAVSLDVELSADDLARIDAAFAPS